MMSSGAEEYAPAVLLPLQDSINDDRIKVAIRVRPRTNVDGVDKSSSQPKRMSFGTAGFPVRSAAVSSQLQIQSDKEARQQHVVCVGETQVSINSATDTRNFVFDYVANPDATQEDVWNNVGLDITRSALQGFNGTIIAYGPTGSGKTHTIFGSSATDFSGGNTPLSCDTDSNKENNAKIKAARSNTNSYAQANTDVSVGAKRQGEKEKEQEQEQSKGIRSTQDMSGLGLVPRALKYIWDFIYSEEERSKRGSASPPPPPPAPPSSSSYISADKINGAISASDATLPLLMFPAEGAAPELNMFDVTVSMCEIYNERVYDLLDDLHSRSPKSSSSSGSSSSSNSAERATAFSGAFGGSILQGASPLQLRDDPIRGIFVENLTEEALSSPQDAEKVLNIGLKNRHTAATLMNRTSSRSHAVFLLRLDHTTERGGVRTCRTSRFTLVDLAGSERQKNTNSTDVQLREAGQINRSLSELGNVIHSLTTPGGPAHIQYRNSKLTYLLRDSLGGNSKTVMMAMVTQSQNSIAETLTTLKFAQRAKKVKNVVRVNEQLVAGTVEALHREIAALKARIAYSEMLVVESQQVQPFKDPAYSSGSSMYSSDMGTSPMVGHSRMPRLPDSSSRAAAAPLSVASYIAQTTGFSPKIAYDREEPIRGLSHDIACADDREGVGMEASVECSPVPRSLVALPSAAIMTGANQFQYHLQMALERCKMADELRMQSELKCRVLQQQLTHAETILQERQKLSDKTDSPTIAAVTAIIRMEIEADLIKQRQIAQELERRMKWTNANSRALRQSGGSSSVVSGWVWRDQDEQVFNHSLLSVLKGTSASASASNVAATAELTALQTELSNAQADAETAQNRRWEMEAELSREKADFERKIAEAAIKHRMEVEGLQDTVYVLEAQSIRNGATVDNKGLSLLLSGRDEHYQRLLKEKGDADIEICELRQVLEDMRASNEEADATAEKESERMKRLAHEVKEFKDRCAIAELTLEHAHMKNAEFNERNSVLSAEKVQMEELLRARDSRIWELEQREARLNAENEWMREEVDSLLVQSESVIGEKQRMKKLLTEHSLEFNKVSAERDVLQENLRGIQESLKRQEGDTAQLAELLFRLETEQAKVVALKGELNAVEVSHQKSTESCAELCSQLLEAGDREKALHRIAADCSEQLNDSRASYEEALEKIGALRDELSALKSRESQFLSDASAAASVAFAQQKTVSDLQMHLQKQEEQCGEYRASLHSSDLRIQMMLQEQNEMASEMASQAKELETALSQAEVLKTEHDTATQRLRVDLVKHYESKIALLNMQCDTEEARTAEIADVAARAVCAVSAMTRSIPTEGDAALSMEQMQSGDSISRLSSRTSTPKSLGESPHSITGGAADRVYPPLISSLNMKALQKRNEAKLDRVHHHRRHRSDRASEADRSTDTVLSTGSASTTATTASQALTEKNTPGSAPGTGGASIFGSAAPTPVDVHGITPYSAPGTGQGQSEFGSAKRSTSAAPTPVDLHGISWIRYADTSLESVALSDVSDASDLFDNSKLMNLVPLRELKMPATDTLPPSLLRGARGPDSAQKGFHDPQLHQSPANNILSPLSRSDAETNDDDDNDFEGVETDRSSNSTPSANISGVVRDIELASASTPLRGTGVGVGFAWDIEKEHNDRVSGEAVSIYSKQVPATLAMHGRIYCRIAHNISLGSTEISGSSNKGHLLSQSLRLSPFMSKGEWKESYWVIQKSSKEFNKQIELKLYRSKSDYFYNAKSSTGVLKTITLAPASGSAKGADHEFIETGKENASENTNSNTHTQLQQQQTSLQKRAAKNISLPPQCQIFAKHIKSKMFKGRPVYSFTLCELRAPSVSGSALGLGLSPKGSIGGGSNYSPASKSERPLIKFASTDRGQVEALWTQIRAQSNHSQ